MGIPRALNIFPPSKYYFEKNSSTFIRLGENQVDRVSEVSANLALNFDSTPSVN